MSRRPHVEAVVDAATTGIEAAWDGQDELGAVEKARPAMRGEPVNVLARVRGGVAEQRRPIRRRTAFEWTSAVSDTDGRSKSGASTWAQGTA